MNLIPEFKEGSDDTPLQASRMNEIVRLLNALRNLTVKPDGSGKLVWGDGNAVLELVGSGGDSGPTLPGSWRGFYDSTATYAAGDEVKVVGPGQGTWICLVAHGPGPADDHAPWLGEDDGTTLYWDQKPASPVSMWT